jgi:hypothetical protein
MSYANMPPISQEAAPIAQSQLWPGSAQPMLSQMILPGGATETTSSDINNKLWGPSPWLQEQNLQHQAASTRSSASSVSGTYSATMALSQAMQNQDHADSVQQETEADDGEVDVDKEIYERAVRFLDEISTDESSAEDQPLPAHKQDVIQPMQVGKQVGAGLNTSAFDRMWNPQEAWVSDVNGQDRWGTDPGLNHWSMQSSDRQSFLDLHIR